MLVIGIAGGSGSGKTTVVKAITRQLQGRVVVIPQDSYYKDSSHVPRIPATFPWRNGRTSTSTIPTPSTGN